MSNTQTNNDIYAKFSPAGGLGLETLARPFLLAVSAQRFHKHPKARPVTMGWVYDIYQEAEESEFQNQWTLKGIVTKGPPGMGFEEMKTELARLIDLAHPEDGKVLLAKLPDVWEVAVISGQHRTVLRGLQLATSLNVAGLQPAAVAEASPGDVFWEGLGCPVSEMYKDEGAFLTMNVYLDSKLALQLPYTLD